MANKIKNLIIVLFVVSPALIWAQRKEKYLPIEVEQNGSEYNTLRDSEFVPIWEQPIVLPGLTLQPKKNEMLIDSIITESKKYIGVPYRRGNSNGRFFDCSGFMKFLFNKRGIQMNASSAEQYKQGESVSTKNLRVGDLVFFKGSNVNLETVGHVGLVIEVDTAANDYKFIHATISQGVMIDDYKNNEYYTRRYVGAKRIIQ